MPSRKPKPIIATYDEPAPDIVRTAWGLLALAFIGAGLVCLFGG